MVGTVTMLGGYLNETLGILASRQCTTTKIMSSSTPHNLIPPRDVLLEKMGNNPTATCKERPQPTMNLTNTIHIVTMWRGPLEYFLDGVSPFSSTKHVVQRRRYNQLLFPFDDAVLIVFAAGVK